MAFFIRIYFFAAALFHECNSSRIRQLQFKESSLSSWFAIAYISAVPSPKSILMECSWLLFRILNLSTSPRKVSTLSTKNPKLSIVCFTEFATMYVFAPEHLSKILFASASAALKDVFPCFLGKKISASLKRLMSVPFRKNPNRFTHTNFCQSVNNIGVPLKLTPFLSSPCTWWMVPSIRSMTKSN